MELKGKLIQKNAPVSGQSSKGMWTKQEFIIETAETYPKKICLNVWNDTLKEVANAKLGDTLTAHVQVESREYNGRWYTEVKAWKFEKHEQPKEQPKTFTEFTEGEQTDLPINEPPF